MVAQSQQLVSIVTKIDQAEIERRIAQGKNGKRQALAKREENKRTGQKPRELKLPPVPHHHAEVYVDRELRQNVVEDTLGQKIKQAVIETVKQIAPTPEEIRRIALEGRNLKGRYVPLQTEAQAKEAYELLKLARLAD